MKNRILDRFGMKMLSLVLAIIVWIVVANVDDYKTTKQISGIEIEFINGDAITEKNKVYEVPQGTSVDVIVKGRRNIVESLSADDFKAVADLSKMSVTNAVAVEVSTVRSNIAKELTITNNNKSVIVSVENKVEKQMPITVRVKSEVAEGYAIKSKTATPNLITVKGGESVVNTIEEVVVDVDVRGAWHNLSAYGEPYFLTHNGEEIDSSKFEYDVESVEIAIEVAKTKELAVRVETTGETAEGYAISSVDYQPTSILVVGEVAELAKVEEIVIDDVDVSGCKEDLEAAVSIADYLPEGIFIADGTEEIMVKVMVEPVVSKSIHIETSEITLVGRSGDYKYTLTSGSGYSIKVSGLKDKIDSLTVDKMNPTIDLSGYGPGKHICVVSFREIAGMSYVDELKVEIEITIEQ